MAHVKKKRLDQRMQADLPHYSRQQIQGWIMRGMVRVEGTVVTKPGIPVADTAQVIYDIEEPKYVGRAGFKLEKALEHFAIDVTGFVALDAGLSTGGFTDCLLQHGAKKVYGIDVGYGQVHEKIRMDDRVVVMERTNLRHLDTALITDKIDIVTLDLSFISMLKVIDVVRSVMHTGATLVVLIKPQFEAERHEVGRGGIITDPAVHESVIERVVSGVQAAGFEYKGVIESPLLGGSGNKEFLGCFIKSD